MMTSQLPYEQPYQGYQLPLAKFYVYSMYNTDVHSWPAILSEATDYLPWLCLCTLGTKVSILTNRPTIQ